MTSNTIASRDPEFFGLLPEELKLQGTFFMNDARLRVENTESSFRIVVAPTPVLALSIMTAAILAFFVGFLVLVKYNSLDALSSGFFWLVFVGAGLLAVVGAPAAHLLRLYHLRQFSPLLEYDKLRQVVRLSAGQLVYAASEVVCIQSLTAWNDDFWHRERLSELNVIVQANDGNRYRHLLITSMNSVANAFNYLLIPLKAATELPVLRVRQKGWFCPGGYIVEEIQ